MTGNKVDSVIGLPMVHVLESTLVEVIVNSDIGSHTACFSLDSASAIHLHDKGKGVRTDLMSLKRHFMEHG